MMEGNPDASRSSRPSHPSRPAISVILSTCPAEAADGLAEALVERRHAACVTVLAGGKSVYRWQGAIERGEESLLLIKCPREGVERLLAALVALHPYDVPEAIALDVAAGHAPYLQWVLESCREDGAAPGGGAEGAGGRHGA